MAIAVRRYRTLYSTNRRARAHPRITAADPELAVAKVEPMRDVLRESVAEPRFRTLLLVAFAGMAVVLAAVGIYGSSATPWRSSGRARSAFRMAPRCPARQVMMPVLRQGFVLAVAGIAIGLAGSVLAARCSRVSSSASNPRIR
jgi:putative ABC transport system permease protein